MWHDVTCCDTKALRHLRFQLPSFEADGLQQVRRRLSRRDVEICPDGDCYDSLW
jgi:hypothetical protein